MRIQLLENMRFIGTTDSNHSIVFDTSKNNGGDETAPTPMEVILIGLGGCTGMDVISILRKMRQKITHLSIDIEYKKAVEHPKVYKNIILHYYIKGIDVKEDKIKKAIELSINKYCSVSAMLSKTAELKYDYKYEEEKYEN